MSRTCTGLWSEQPTSGTLITGVDAVRLAITHQRLTDTRSTAARKHPLSVTLPRRRSRRHDNCIINNKPHMVRLTCILLVPSLEVNYPDGNSLHALGSQYRGKLPWG